MSANFINQPTESTWLVLQGRNWKQNTGITLPIHSATWLKLRPFYFAAEIICNSPRQNKSCDQVHLWHNVKSNKNIFFMYKPAQFTRIYCSLQEFTAVYKNLLHYWWTQTKTKSLTSLEQSASVDKPGRSEEEWITTLANLWSKLIYCICFLQITFLTIPLFF